MEDIYSMEHVNFVMLISKLNVAIHCDAASAQGPQLRAVLSPQH